MNIKQQLRDMPESELHIFAQALSQPLSSSDTGEGKAWHTLAKIESFAINEIQERKKLQDTREEFAEQVKKDTRPRFIKDLKPEHIQAEIAKHGIHIVANWKSGESDALDLNIFNTKQLREQYPEISVEDADAFFAGTKNELKSNPYFDDLSREVQYTIYHPLDYLPKSKEEKEMVENDIEIYYYDD